MCTEQAMLMNFYVLIQPVISTSIGLQAPKSIASVLFSKSDLAGWLDHDMASFRAKTIERGVVMGNNKLSFKHFSVNC